MAGPKKTALIILFLLFLPILSMTIPTTFSPKVKMGIAQCFGPLLNVGGSLAQKVTHALEWMKGHGKLIRAKSELTQRVAYLAQEVTRLKEASIENERLRGLLKFKRKTPYKVIPARVIARDSTNWYSTIVIDKGSNHNIYKDMPLIAPSGLVGRIIDVSSTLSRGMLIVDPNSRVGAMVQRSREDGVIEGSLRGLCRMKYVSIDADIREGDLVISSGMGGIFPKGLIIGRIKKIETEPKGLHLYAWIEPMVNFSKLEEVLCVVRDTRGSF